MGTTAAVEVVDDDEGIEEEGIVDPKLEDTIGAEDDDEGIFATDFILYILFINYVVCGNLKNMRTILVINVIV